MLKNEKKMIPENWTKILYRQIKYMDRVNDVENPAPLTGPLICQEQKVRIAKHKLYAVRGWCKSKSLVPESDNFTVSIASNQMQLKKS